MSFARNEKLSAGKTKASDQLRHNIGEAALDKKDAHRWETSKQGNLTNRSKINENGSGSKNKKSTNKENTGLFDSKTMNSLKRESQKIDQRIEALRQRK